MGKYGGGFVKNMIAVQEPAKMLLRKIASGEISPEDIKVLFSVFKEISTLPELDKSNLSPNSIILWEIWQESRRHLTEEFLVSYGSMLDLAAKFVILKLDYDSFYSDLFNWAWGEAIRKGYVLPAHNRPNTTLWKPIPDGNKDRIAKSVRDNYKLFEERRKVILEKMGDSEEGKTHISSRESQFINRVLNDIEREVINWEV